MSPLYLGIDVGSTTVKVVLTDAAGNLLEHVYRRAHGQPGRVLLEALEGLARCHDLVGVGGVGVTGSGSGLFAPLLGGLRVNELVAQSHALEIYAPSARTVIEMGGQDSKLLILTQEDGRLRLAGFAMNTLCAAGTGSFLDQQAERLGLSIEEFAALALQSQRPARIAGRCTVFAKSDMVHLQQRGVPLPDVVAGLCLAVARNFRSIVGQGKLFHAPLFFQGGVARNAGMVWAFEQVLGLERGALAVLPHCTLMAALGAGRIARLRAGEALPFRGLAPLAESLVAACDTPSSLPALAKTKVATTNEMVCGDGSSRLATAEVVTTNEVARNDDAGHPVYLGVDVGSIGTKVVLLDAGGQYVAGVCLPTAGQPLEAVRQGLRQVADAAAVADAGKVRVLGAGVTGSGRRLIGEEIGADVVRDEITTQARAALACDAGVDTVFEIGGQDSKYISLRDGAVMDFAMNKACAAGTGAFLEEQAGRMHFPVESLGSLALAAPAPADLGERCTVFMESDLVHHQQQGVRREDLAAGLAYAVARNYLHRVVQGRPIGERVLFQGGVASNPAVVAAFERLLGRPVTVPPHHVLSGAIGAALLAREAQDEYGATRFRGFDASPQPPRPPFSSPAAGGEGGCRGDEAGFDLFAEREELLLRCLRERPPGSGRPRVGIPRVLTFYDLLPFWACFFQELGWEVVLSPPTTPEIVASATVEAGAETCFPVKLAYGHVWALLAAGVECVFLPSLVNRADPLPGHTQSYHCPYVQAVPHLVEAALRVQGRSIPLLHPPLHFLWPGTFRRDLGAFARDLGVSAREVEAARRAAEEAQRGFAAAWRRRGEEVLAGLSPGQGAAVIVGRAYSTADPGINGGVPQKLRRLGVPALPMDLLPLAGVDITDLASNMFWYSGQRILAAARLIQHDPRLQAVYVTNFACGPDSFLRSFFRAAMAGKPFLELELDDHSADVGLETRLEAFFIGSRQVDKEQVDKGAGGTCDTQRASRITQQPTVYIPNVCDPAHVLAAALRRYGLQAEVLPPSNEETLALGRDLCLGRECLPCYTIVGDIVRRARLPGFDPAVSVYLIPTSAGPCRLGQFHDLLCQVLKREGLQALQVVAPSAENGYQYAGLGAPPLRVGRLAWQGLVAVNLLEKLLLHHRPYERVTGSADDLYEMLLWEVVRAIESGGGRRVVAVVEEAVRRFAGLGADRSARRPVVGLVGELYLRLNPFTNQQIIRRVEALGGEVWLAPMMEWFYYANSFARFSARAAHRTGDLVKIFLAYLVQRWEERRLLAPVETYLPNGREPTVGWIQEAVRPYYHPVLRTEAPLSIGKAIDFARHGADGILNVMPFTCMPGTVVAGLAQRVRADCGNIPWLDAIFDGQGETNLQMRLEAFLYQAEEFRGRKQSAISE